MFLQTQKIEISHRYIIALYVTQADALPVNEVGILKIVKNYWCRNPIQSNRLAHLYLLKSKNYKNIYTVLKDWFYKTTQWEIQSRWLNSCISCSSALETYWGFSLMKTGSVTLMLLFSTLLSLLFLTFLLHINTCSLARNILLNFKLKRSWSWHPEEGSFTPACGCYRRANDVMEQEGQKQKLSCFRASVKTCCIIYNTLLM